VCAHTHTHSMCKVSLIYNNPYYDNRTESFLAQFDIADKKSPISFVNSVVKHEAQHTEDNFKSSRFLLVHMYESVTYLNLP